MLDGYQLYVYIENTDNGATQMKFAIGTPVIHNGRFANVTGRDNGEERAIIEYCDTGMWVTVRDADLIVDQDSLDDEAAFQASLLK